jgi:hypothetical protein
MNSAVSKPVKRSPRSKLTLQILQQELTVLRQRVEDLEDVRELNQAIERNGSKPLTSWSKARKDLGI